MATIVAVICDQGGSTDVEIPLDLTVNQLIAALHKSLRRSGPCPVAMRSENPVAFLMGDRPLSAYGLHQGSHLYFCEE